MADVLSPTLLANKTLHTTSRSIPFVARDPWALQILHCTTLNGLCIMHGDLDGYAVVSLKILSSAIVDLF